MIKFITIDPSKREIAKVSAHDLRDAEVVVGLDPSATDHGTIRRGIGYVIYEYAFFKPVEKQSYCAIDGRLIAGPIVLYGYDERGETIDLELEAVPKVMWFDNAHQAELLIRAGLVARPQIAAGGKLLWEWPQRVEPGFMGYKGGE